MSFRRYNPPVEQVAGGVPAPTLITASGAQSPEAAFQRRASWSDGLAELNGRFCKPVTVAAGAVPLASPPNGIKPTTLHTFADVHE
ncbi:MAG: hypothetical protein ABSH40_02635 [Bryobacteraceae bacterium]